MYDIYSERRTAVLSRPLYTETVSVRISEIDLASSMQQTINISTTMYGDIPIINVNTHKADLFMEEMDLDEDELVDTYKTFNNLPGEYYEGEHIAGTENKLVTITISLREVLGRHSEGNVIYFTHKKDTMRVAKILDSVLGELQTSTDDSRAMREFIMAFQQDMLSYSKDTLESDKQKLVNMSNFGSPLQTHLENGKNSKLNINRFDKLSMN